MKSPLAYDNDIAKEFDITEDLDVTYKLAFARTQLDEIKKALYRQRVDLMIAQYQVDNATDEHVKSQHQSKVYEHRLLLEQFVRSIKVLTQLVDELQASE